MMNKKVSMAVSSVDIPSSEIFIEGNVDMNTMAIGGYDYQTFENDSSGISSVTVLIIVIAVCVILGIFLGIVAGKKNANK